MSDIPLIKKVQFIEADFSAGPVFSVKARPFSSITLRISGRISVAFGEKTLFSEPNSLTYIPCGCPYTTQIQEPGKMYILHFYTVDGSPLFANEPMVTTPDFPLRFRNLFQNAISAFLSGECELAAMSAAYELLSAARGSFFGTPPKPPKRMIKVKQFIDENITDPSVHIPMLAEMCGISQVYFRSEFKKYYGASPLSYIKNRRIELACGLLSLGVHSITEVATLSGFESISYFSSEFRRIKGCAPGKYLF